MVAYTVKVHQYKSRFVEKHHAQVIFTIIFCFYNSIITVNGNWENWSVWSICDKSCNNGSRTRYRQCVQPKHGGFNCTGQNIQSSLCNSHNCPGII